MKSRIVAAAVMLIGCSGCAPDTNSVITTCLPLKTWSDADQDQLRQEYDALPKDAKMRIAFMDYVTMRDADRACQQSAQ